MTQGNNDEPNDLRENTTIKIKRSSLFVINGILESVEMGKGHRARFQEIARLTPELRNRGKLVQYLKLLIDDLWWLEKKEEIQKTRWNPKKSTYVPRRWNVYWYRVTDRGKLFLELFPHKVENDTKEEYPAQPVGQ